MQLNSIAAGISTLIPKLLNRAINTARQSHCTRPLQALIMHPVVTARACWYHSGQTAERPASCTRHDSPTAAITCTLRLRNKSSSSLCIACSTLLTCGQQRVKQRERWKHQMLLTPRSNISRCCRRTPGATERDSSGCSCRELTATSWV